MAPSKKENCNIQVFVRVRPFNAREISLKQTVPSVSIVGRSASGTVIGLSKESASSELSGQFVCDECFWSVDPTGEQNSTQENIFERIGSPCVQHVIDGFSACIFAYGQTGSGKTHTMTGTPEDEGLIPRMTRELVEKVVLREDSLDQVKRTHELKTTFRLIVRYFEIYNEKAYDLLVPNSPALRVREHPVTGPFVEGAKELTVSNWNEMNGILEKGAENRHTAATLMNDKSSRSHSVFQVHLTQSTKISTTNGPGKVVKRESKLNLVDLAGSESAKKTGATGDTAVEGQNINVSLLTLGKLIDALLQKQTNASKAVHIPYRDSTLTFFLKESIGGNSRTVMLAMISPAMDNWAETKNTLTYASRARKLVNVVHIIEDEAKQVIDDLKAENERLKKLLTDRGSDVATEQQVQRNQALIDDLHAREEKAKVEWELREKELLIQGEKDAAVRQHLERERDLMKSRADENERDLLRRNDIIMQLEERMRAYEDRLISEMTMKEELQAALTAKEEQFSGETQQIKSALSMKSMEAKKLSVNVQKKEQEILGTLQNCYDRIDFLERKVEELTSQLAIAEITIEDLRAVHAKEKKELQAQIEHLRTRPVILSASRGSIEDTKSEWRCPQCTYKNQEASERCYICGCASPALNE